MKVVILLVLTGVVLYTAITLNQSKLISSLKQYIKNKMANDFTGKVIPEIKTDNKDNQAIRFRFTAIADVHNSVVNLKQSTNLINQNDSDFIIGLGDYTNTGTDAEFAKISEILKLFSKQAFYLPGDHDLWNGRDKTDNPLIYYHTYFSDPPEALVHKDVTFIFINNADIYQGVSKEEEGRIMQHIAQASTPTLVIVSHKPMYHPLTIHRMGYINEEKVEKVAFQAERIVQKVTEIKEKKAYMVHGDLHSSSTFSGPTDNTTNFTVGALTSQKNFQTPRYAQFTVYEDGAIKMEDKVINIAP